MEQDERDEEEEAHGKQRLFSTPPEAIFHLCQVAVRVAALEAELRELRVAARAPVQRTQKFAGIQRNPGESADPSPEGFAHLHAASSQFNRFYLAEGLSVFAENEAKPPTTFQGPSRGILCSSLATAREG